MSGRLNFSTLDVFTSYPFSGNPLAIVHVPKELRDTLSQSQKQTIAREFNLSETVFLHEGVHDEPIRIDIFITDAELPFAGHPTVGSGWYLLSTQNQTRGAITLKTKAGDIPVSWAGEAGGKVQLRVPTDFKIHPSYTHPRAKFLQTRLTSSDYLHGSGGNEAVASIVKGMTFLLVELTSEDALTRLQPVSEGVTVPDIGEWAGFCGLYAFYQREDGIVRTRMFDATLEDPATGSAASTLAGWLAKKRGRGTHEFKILQGVEMGRRSEIDVVVEIDETGEISTIMLSGCAVLIMEGYVTIPA